MKTSYLDYYKMILEKVSFNRLLFAKEYLKAVEVLDQREVHELEQWLVSRGLKKAESRLASSGLLQNNKAATSHPPG